MDKGLQNIFKGIVNKISEKLPIMRESGSEVSHFIIEPRNVSEVTRLSSDIGKPWIEADLKDINNLINNQTFLVYEQEKGEPMNPCMDVYTEKIQFV